MSALLLASGLVLLAPPLPVAAMPAPVSLVVLAQGQSTPLAVSADPALLPAAPQSGPPQTGSEDLVVTARARSAGDPLQSVNLQSFEVTQAIDIAVIRPVAKTYQKILPAPVRDGIRNVLNNLREPVTALNCILQHKIGRAAKTIGRFLVNTTVGVGGIFDMARRKPFKLRQNPNGFANTLGFYGVKTGAFLYVPLVGPTTVRDLIGSTVDRFVIPFAVGGPLRNPAVTVPMGVFGTLDQRAQLDETIEALRQDKQKAYQATREFYLTRRQAQIDELHDQRRRIVRPVPGSIKPSVTDATGPR